MTKTFLASTVALALAGVSWPAHAEDQAVAADTTAGRGKMTKADAARWTQPETRPSSSTSAASYTAVGPHRESPASKRETEDETAARGVEKEGLSPRHGHRQARDDHRAHSMDASEIARTGRGKWHRRHADCAREGDPQEGA